MGQTLKFLFLIFIFLSCTPQEKTTTDSTKAPRATLIAKWNPQGLKDSPLTVVLAQEFLPHISEEEGDNTGLNAIELMAQKWNEAHSKLDFYSLPFTVATNKDYENLDDYLDDEIGIYYSKKWYRELSPGSLAITQFFGVRKNVGQPNEYFELAHGDIIVNFRDFEYFTKATPKTFDLLTVLLHEMGHLIGLPHTSNPSVHSVMSPFLEKGEMRRELTPYDIETIYKYYPLDDIAPAAISSLQSIHDTEILERYIIELRVDGSCRHYLNGQFLYSH